MTESCLLKIRIEISDDGFAQRQPREHRKKGMRFTTSSTVAMASLAATMALDLIRVNQNGQTESDNMGDYDIWTCKHEGNDRTCSFRTQGLMDYAEVRIILLLNS
jgi:hypothetical protein